MRSPFPGMDPYLEDLAFWPDFHSRFINYCCEALTATLPDNYDARIGERVNLIEVEPERVKRIGPDISITRDGEQERPGAKPGGIATLEPVTIPWLIEEESRETYIEVLRREDRTLVTVIEVLSPSNKEGDGRVLYLAKHNALFFQRVSLVEVDLLLGGQRLPLAKPYPAGDYFALIARAFHRPDCQVYGWPLEQPLPTIPIPLRAPDPDILLNLEDVFHTTYERGRYRKSIDYSQPPAI
ncbi:MAG TPA: DUF4058 family protein, partial [Lacipirellulaceae bacterium]|nr:DUF4058 family protein [Lacipirellulaceae bacterium]